MFSPKISGWSQIRTSLLKTATACLALTLLAGGVVAFPAAGSAQAPPKKTGGTARRPMTQADVEKQWKNGDDTLLANEIGLRNLAFTPSGVWVDVELPTETGIEAAKMPRSAAALRRLVPPPPSIEEVAKKAPDIFTALKAAAQKRSDAEMAPLVDPSLMLNKARVYDLFDISNFRAYTLGQPAEGGHGDVGMPFFQLTTSNVEKLYYIVFGQSKGKLVIRNIVTGPQVAELYLHDEKALADKKLDVMFRALNDGDQSGIKTLCTPALYEAIQAWGGNKHPGDRLTRGHSATQVTVESSVPLDQKSVRVVTKVSYALSSKSNIVFFIDFERIDNELKVVRIRDSENKVIVYDPNIDNYLNRRYSLPDGPIPDANDIAMTEDDVFLPMDKLRAKVIRVLQYHDVQKISDLASLFVESDPTSGEGFGIRAAADLMQHNTDKADQDAHKALELNGTVYFVVDRYTKSSAKPFTPAVLAISKTKLQYIPAAGYGTQETIPAASVVDAKFAKGIGAGGFNLLEAGPFLKFQYKASDGKKKIDFDFADYGTTCPTNDKTPPDLIAAASNGTCGSVPGNGTSRPTMNPIMTPQNWHEDLAVVADALNGLRGGSTK